MIEPVNLAISACNISTWVLKDRERKSTLETWPGQRRRRKRKGQTQWRPREWVMGGRVRNKSENKQRERVSQDPNPASVVFGFTESVAIVKEYPLSLFVCILCLFLFAGTAKPARRLVESILQIFLSFFYLPPFHSSSRNNKKTRQCTACKFACFNQSPDRFVWLTFDLYFQVSN